ncbi:hypothetical protein WJX79_001439 [Trebouxia sp. C0005]
MAKHGSRYRNSALAVLQPRSRRETVFLIGILIIATFFIVRICQFRSLTPRGNTITAVLSTTQVVRGKHGPDGDDEPTAVFTEVFIDSGSGEGFKRPRKQPDVQVKYDNQRKSSLQKSALGSNKADALPDVSKGNARDNQSDSSDNSVQRRSAVNAQQLDGLRTKLDPRSAGFLCHYFSVFKEHNEVKWTPAPLESLLNVDKIVDFWRGRGLTVHRTPALLPFPDLTQPELAYPMYPQPEIDPELIARIDDVYLRNLDMPELIEKARIAVIGHAGKLLRQDPSRKIDYIVLDMPCTFFMLRSLSNLRVVTEVARSLEFSDQVANLADRVIHGMTMGGKNEYNAVHLRIEKDARDWSQIMGGEQVVWRGYVQSMLQASFTSDLVLYAASGLLTYGANDEMDNLIGSLKDAGLCKDVHYKELYIPQAELEELNSEQKALVDFLVLSRGRGFVGFGSSTFSFYLREFRVLSGIPRSSSVLVDASVIGTDPLFNSAGTVI